MAVIAPSRGRSLLQRVLLRFGLWYAAAAVILFAWSGLVLRSLLLAAVVAAASTLATMLADPGSPRRPRS